MNLALYVRDVLGVTNYLCPKKIHKVRQLEGTLPTKVLVIVFELLTDSQKKLLKKIISSLGELEYSLLQIKEKNLLDSFFKKEASFWAEFVFVFGKNENKNHEKRAYPFFYTIYSLKELEGVSQEVREKKQKLWKALKLWKDTVEIK
ncbi:MAG: hypothetical protein GDA46_00980 [Bdellovibrionales bacterium]|nr:hypothetical protein [Bdellovibrionales bacterium]